jgi:ribonuclease-3
LPSPPPELSSPLEARLGHRFQDRALLKAALTPPSAGLPEDNQRLEFLGDSILNLCVSAMACREQPQWDEGALSKLRGLLVCTDALHAWAVDLGIVLERGPRSARKGKAAADPRKALADAVEALLAAVFLDVQGRAGDPLAAVQAIIERRFLKETQAAYMGVWETRDSKTTLQERAATLGLPPPAYEQLERTGPDHAPTFTVEVRLGEQRARASASTLKRAQSAAARALLQAL